MRKSNNQGSVLVVIIVILTIGVIGLLGYVAWNNFLKPSESTQSDQNTTQSTPNNPPQNSEKTYVNMEAGISFQYPSEWKTEEKIEKEYNTPESYVSYVTVFNQNGVEVASLSTRGQLGGLCPEDALFVDTSTIKLDHIDITGVGAVDFGYTIIKTSENHYNVVYGLAKSNRLSLGNKSLQCPDMSIGYKYYTDSKVKKLNLISFAMWASRSRSFVSFNDAKQYASSQEFSQIERMIKSLKINS